MLIGPCLLLTVNEWWIWPLHCQQKLPSEIRHNQISVWEKAGSKSSAKKYQVFKSSIPDLTSSHSQLINLLHISKQSMAQKPNVYPIPNVIIQILCPGVPMSPLMKSVFYIFQKKVQNSHMQHTKKLSRQKIMIQFKK
jgi:hypothetical protein